jgi:hypothetical protein
MEDSFLSKITEMPVFYITLVFPDKFHKSKEQKYEKKKRKKRK